MSDDDLSDLAWAAEDDGDLGAWADACGDALREDALATETPVRFSWMALGHGSSVSNSTRVPVTREQALAIAIKRFDETWGREPTMVELAPLDQPELATWHVIRPSKGGA